MKIGFITWDGPDQNYMESLFLPIFGRVAKHGEDVTFSTLQFTWDFDTTSIERASEQLGFGYESADVLRKPLKPATAFMIAIGGGKVIDFCKRHDVEMLMPRSIIPAAMVMIARKALPDIKVCFDADGFVADERVDFLGWSSSGITYRIFRDVEAQMTRAADSVVVRTRRAKEILRARAGSGVDPDKIFVVSNGKDADAFRPLDEKERLRAREGAGVPEEAPWIVYAGSIGPQYHPLEMLRFFELVRDRRPDARLQILTGQVDEMRNHVVDAGLGDFVDVRRVPPDDVPNYLGAADVGLALRKPTFSQRGVAPIKVGEYLLCGLPVVATRGVGDIDEQLDPSVGHLLDTMDDEALSEAADWFCDEVLADRDGFRTRCRTRGVEEFGMDTCAERYLRAIEYARGRR